MSHHIPPTAKAVGFLWLDSVIWVKTLKKHKNGLIINESFSVPPMDDRLRPNAVYSYGSSAISIQNGEIAFDIQGAENCVVEVENNYIAMEQGDFGGLRIRNTSSKRDFVEYYTENPGTYRGVRIVKTGNLFQGKGSHNMQLWEDRGSVTLSSVDTVSVVVGGSTPYELLSFKAYESEFVNIYGTLDGWELYINNSLVTTSVNGEMVFKLNTYPFSGNFKIYDGEALVCECDLYNVWGGDDYECTVDVDILNEFHEVFPVIGEEFLGNLNNGYILKQYYLKNNSDEDVQVTLRVAEYSPFYDWVWLSLDEIDLVAYNDYFNSLETTIEPYGEVPFYLYIKRPDNAIDYDYKNKVCTFFLEVV